ncbi:sensor histidine kinase [Maribacter sp. ACAM166]|uniref:sensor histidine kinase n=1 Tax=Maribacter sp. ACAM166 TaxID=2508996 RepID=UPI0010FE6FA6|nr:HAMP domain-containing sensor histidine kinase [Maribacter sp. ACAM166]TLP75711.1 HAMP domain-containing histidine kinase [Maribacter sp. ACAM166]
MTAHTKKIRLLRKTSKTFLWISLVLMVFSTIGLYFYVQNLLQREVEEELRSTEARIKNSISENSTMYQLPPMVEVETVSQLEVVHLKDTLIFDPSQNEIEEFRELTSFSIINNQKYRITVRALIVESEDILIAVVVSYLIVILLVFIFLFYLNKSRTRKLWHPFFKNLEQMKLFSLTSENTISLVDSDILEFSELNTEITTLTDKVRSDYKTLKQFTEDVSHELQTPLAIIQAKVDTIINGEKLNNLQFEQLSSIQNDIHRLKQLNKKLGLLSKIENKQFENVTPCNLNKVLEKRIENLSELYPSEIQLKSKEEVILLMDENLAVVLCENLLSNAIKYALPNTPIEVVLEKGFLTVKNKGARAILKPDQLFHRFYKESDEVKSTVLGLAIVKKICDRYGFKPSYSYDANEHHFKIFFQEN